MSDYRTHRLLVALQTPSQMRFRFALGENQNLIICFAGIGGNRREMPPDEFLGTVLRNDAAHCLFVSDEKRSWMNDVTYVDTLQKTVAGLVREHHISRIITLGISMGGFSALVASTLFPVTTAFAIAPQFSMSADLMPDEKRWAYWRDRIRNFRYETADVANPPPQTSIVVHAGKNDGAHMRRFASRKDCAHLVFPNASHSEIGGKLKHDNVLEDALKLVVEGQVRAVPRLLRKHGAVWRRETVQTVSQPLTTPPNEKGGHMDRPFIFRTKR